MNAEELIKSLGIDSSVPVTQKPVDHLDKVEELALNLMTEHGLLESGWTFKWDRAEKRAGECVRSRKNGNHISLSRPLMSVWTIEQAREVILHEIAHALVGPSHHHDWTWKMQALRIGAKAERCWGNNGEKNIEGKYRGVCPNGHVAHRFRKSRNMHEDSCTKCSPRWDPRYLIKWTEV